MHLTLTWFVWFVLGEDLHYLSGFMVDMENVQNLEAGLEVQNH